MINVVKDPNTLLLLHGEDFTDSSIYGHTVTNSGVSVSSAQSKFGGSSLYFNGSSRLSISPVGLFEFGTGDWTFDAWVYPLSQSTDNFFFSGAANGALFIGRQSGNGTLGIGRANVAWDNAITSTLMLNTWNHVAYVKSSGKIYYFVNGKLAGSANNAISYGVLGGVLNIGSQGANYYFNGYMDEVRMSNIARWTETFTPPTAPYVASTATITSGGVIPKKHALRRKMMSAGIKPDENTLLLLHGEDFVDSSKYGRTVENHGVSISTSHGKFGGSSFYFNGSSWMKIDVSGGAKTLDFWFYTNLAQTSGIYQTPFSLVLSGVRTYMHVDDATSSAYPIYRVIYSGSVIGGNGSTIITRGAWHHIAYCTDGQGNHKFYLDGVLQRNISRTIGEYAHLIMGVAADYGDKISNATYFTGYIDEIRVSDVERWTANFTPPTKPY